MGRSEVQKLRTAVSRELVQRGFHRLDRVHLKKLDREFSVWVDAGPIGKREDIAPFVGLRHETLEKMRAELMELPTHEALGTVGANVGYVLGGDYRSWNPPGDPLEVLVSIDAAIDRLRLFATIDNLPQAWNIEGARAPGWQYNEILAWYFANNRAEMVRRLAEAESELCEREGEVCDQFRSFSERLQEKYFW